MRRSIAAIAVIAHCLLPGTAVAEQPDDQALARLARVWGEVRFFHPWLLYRDIDWDQPLLDAIPKMEGATEGAALAAVVGEMLGALGDPATRVVGPRPTRPAAEAVPFSRWDGDVLVISPGPFATSAGPLAIWPEASKIGPELQKAERAVIDLRFRGRNPEDDAMFAAMLPALEGLTTREVHPPAARYVHHDGYVPQVGSTSGGYSTGFVTPAPPPVRKAAAAPARIAFIVDAESPLPQDVLALRGAGQAILVSEEPLTGAAAAAVREVDLGGGWRARIRVSELVEPAAVAADAIHPSAAIVEAAVALVRSGSGFTPRARSETALPPGLWRPDARYAAMHFPDLPHRMLALFRLWNVIEHFYPYKDLIGDWDAALLKHIPAFRAAQDAESYARAVFAMTAEIDDGHVHASGHPSFSDVFGEAWVRLVIRKVEGEWVATRWFGHPLPEGIEVGDVVESIDGEPLPARIARIRELLAGATDEARDARAARAAPGGPEGLAVLELRGADGELKRVTAERIRNFGPPIQDGEVVRILPGNIGYVDLTRLEIAGVDAMFETLAETKAIIFDMRGYPRGTAWSIAPRIHTAAMKVGALFSRPQPSGRWDTSSSPRLVFEQAIPTGEGRKYTGMTLMLIDDRAISQAEHSGLFFEAAAGTMFVGSPTAGTNGDVTRLTLPGGFLVSFTGQAVRHADGRQLQRVGLQPHIEVRPTIAGVRAGRDEVLEAAVEYVRGPEDQSIK